MYTHGLLATVDASIFEPPGFVQNALVVSNEADQDQRRFLGHLDWAEDAQESHHSVLSDMESTQQCVHQVQATLESMKAQSPEYDCASLESSLKELATSAYNKILEWIQKAKEYVLRIWRMFTDRVQIIQRKAVSLKSKLEGRTLTHEQAERIANLLVEKHPTHVRNISVDKHNRLVIHPNQVAFFKKYLSLTVDTQEADTKISKAIVQRLKNQVKNIKQGQDLDTDLDPKEYAGLILKRFGKDTVAPGGRGFRKSDVIEGRISELPQYAAFETKKLLPELTKFAFREGNLLEMVEFIVATTKDGSTFATSKEEERRRYFDELQAITETSVGGVMKTKGYEDTQHREQIRQVQAVIRTALEMGYKATTALYRAWLEVLGSMLLIASAYATAND